MKEVIIIVRLICVIPKCNKPVYLERSQLYCKECLEKVEKRILKYYKKEVM